MRLIVSLVGVLFLLAGCSGEPSPPPLDLGEASSSSTGLDVEAGTKVAFGLNMAKNMSAEPVVLNDVTLTGSEDQTARVTDTWAVDFAGGDLFTIGAWPTDRPLGALQEVDGFQLRPGGTAQIIFVIDVEDEGIWKWEGMTLTYSYQGQSYVGSSAHGLVLCAPVTSADCSP